MWQYFTERARKVVFYAQEEARNLGDNYVATEHLLLGLARANDGVAALVLQRIGVSASTVQVETTRVVARGDGTVAQEMQLTPDAKKVLDLAYDESRRMNTGYVGTEHILLGMLRDNESAASQVLSRLGLNLDRARSETTALYQQGANDAQPAPQQQAAWPPAPRPYGQPAAYGQQPAAYPSSGQAPSGYNVPPGYQAQIGNGQPRQKKPSKLEEMRSRGGVGGAIAAFLLFLAKGGAAILTVLAKLKFLVIIGHFLLTGGSMFLTMFLYSYRFGWPFAIGFVLSIFVHECGHAIAARQHGLPFRMMVFVPFMGAFVSHRSGSTSVVDDAYIGIMGPVFGTLYGAACVGLYFATGSPFWATLAGMVFLMNLFNMAPVAPLDGGWIVPVFSPKILALGMIFLIPLGFLNPLILLLGVASLPRVIAGWKQVPSSQAYFTVTAADRLKYAIAYPGLAAILAIGWLFCTGHLAGVLAKIGL